MAAAHFGTFLVLDETGLADELKNDNPYPIVKKTVLRLNKGIEKGRMNQPSRQKWWMGILSTSNKSLDEMAVDLGSKCPDAVRTRLIDVPMPVMGKGAFENLHELDDERAFSVRLQEIARDYYGMVARKFIGELVIRRKRNPKGVERWLSRQCAKYRGYAKIKVDGGGQKLDRITDTFATIYAAGRAAIELKILPWTYQALGDALVACEQAHVDEASDKLTDLSAEIGAKEAWRRIQEFVRNNRRNFVDLRRGLPEDDQSFTEIFVSQPRNRPLEYLFGEDWLVESCGSAKTWDRLKRGLRTEGALVTNKTRFVVKRQVCRRRDDGTDNRASVFAIRADAFEDKRSPIVPRRELQETRAHNREAAEASIQLGAISSPGLTVDHRTRPREQRSRRSAPRRAKLGVPRRPLRQKRVPGFKKEQD